MAENPVPLSIDSGDGGLGGMSKRKLLIYAALIGGGLGLVVFLVKGKKNASNTQPVQQTDMLSTNAAIALGSLQYQLLQFQGAQSVFNQEQKDRLDRNNHVVKKVSANMETGFNSLDTELDLVAGQLAQTGEAISAGFGITDPNDFALFLGQMSHELDAFRHQYDAGGGSGIAFIPVSSGATGTNVVPATAAAA